MISAIRNFFIKRKITRIIVEHQLKAKFWGVLAAKAINAGDQEAAEEYRSAWEHQLRIVGRYGHGYEQRFLSQ